MGELKMVFLRLQGVDLGLAGYVKNGATPIILQNILLYMGVLSS